MGIIQNKITIKWNAKTKNYYVSKGYTFTKIGKNFEINIKDLYPGSKVTVLCECEYCMKQFSRAYYRAIQIYNKKLKSERKMCCSNCKCEKIKEINQEKYGYDYPFQSKEILQKTKESCFNHYGVENPFQSEEVKKQIKETWIKNYGVDNPAKADIIKEKEKNIFIDKYGDCNPWKNKEIKTKIEQTWIKNYGTNHPMKNEEYKQQVLNKVKQSNLEKYGYEFPFQSKEIRIKGAQTMYENGSFIATKPQVYIWKQLGGESKCKLNYPVGECKLDIAFPDKKLYIEYDGSGHDLSIKYGKTQKEFQRYEINRQYYLKKQDWKLIRIISKKDLLPTKKRFIRID